MNTFFSIFLSVVLLVFGAASPYFILQDDYSAIVASMQEDINEEEHAESMELFNKYFNNLILESQEIVEQTAIVTCLLHILGRDHSNISNPPPQFISMTTRIS